MACRASPPCSWNRVEWESTLHKGVQHHTKSPGVSVSTIILLADKYFGGGIILASAPSFQEGRFGRSGYIASEAKICQSKDWVGMVLPIADGVESGYW